MDVIHGYETTFPIPLGLSCTISWKKQKDAIGYSIFYGIAWDKLYNSIMVYGDNFYDFRGLDKDTKYYFEIEPFNENGIRPRSTILTK